MSSVYRLLCMNHDPALMIGSSDWVTAEEAIAAALEPAMYDWLVEDHGKCDLLVGRYSASLVEVCCPGGALNRGHRHGDPKWIDRDWLALLHAASAAPADPAIRAAIEDLAHSQSCWTWQRADRLAAALGIETASALEPPTVPPSTRALRCSPLPSAGEAVDAQEPLRRAIRRGMDHNNRLGMDVPDLYVLNPVEAERYAVGHNDQLVVNERAALLRVDTDVRPGLLRVVTDTTFWYTDLRPATDGSR